VSCAVHAGELSYAYPGGRGALAGVDLHVGHGERVAVLGPNGAGKTTLLLHLNGLLRGSGSLEVAGLEVDGRRLAELRARVGLVFQDPDDQLFMPTVAEDVAFGPLNLGIDREAVAERVAAALAAVRMAAHRDRAPHQLSMGERRRVAIATVLAMRPRLLALDEPSANLDPRSRQDLIDVLAAISGTMLIATHDIPLAVELCERAVILAGGRIVADGPCREILADGRLLEANDLRVPTGFDLELIATRPHPERRAGADRERVAAA
jgi:cobalt/nickel transport system ATP-binding protein